ncbi:deoxynucleoside kinase [Anaerobacillus alkaliphilus]|uniref:Deoxynucleoside kinase n=1 Tax=Anaerobacillus alkaliphilus TaxID=1548597 RepID=A0A4Q0VX26_9BACI|nr:deoxynucleoside kinase [Anaerobacillus alkaliphilus]RXJ04039.1 deoxynucleoside kinase [Anaerobacillus alkaliphilus]
MKQVPFIAVEGPIGVGKSSLAREISNYYQYTLLNEIVEENPFLGNFYKDIDEWSFQTEMFFLCNRYKQLEDIKKYHLAQGQPAVADYHIFKNQIFAERTLQSQQYEKYKKIYYILTENMPEPNLIIYLRASLDTLLERISLRGRDIEKNIDPAYLFQLSSDYDKFMEKFSKDHPNVPVITFDGDKIDFVKNKQHLKTIFSEIDQHLCVSN